MKRFTLALRFSAGAIAFASATAFANGPVDTDGDGLPDAEEILLGTAIDNPDTDGDGLTDFWEVHAFGTDPLDPDTDRDTLKDGDEVLAFETDPLNPDSDDDGLPDGQEVFFYRTLPLVWDTDGDGISDGDEVFILRYDPLNPDTDDNGLDDGDEDDDGDRLTNAQELYLTKTDPLVADSDDNGTPDGDEDADGDGLDSVGELEAGTRLDVADTDGDGLNDGDEVLRHLTSPLDKDSDGDGLGDAEEVAADTDPNDADSDDDGLIDGAEARWNDDVDGDGLINALDPDSDGDGVLDGTEMGVFEPHPDTNVSLGYFVADADFGRTRTDMLRVDTDGGGVADGVEDANKNGAIDDGETDPNDFFDDGVGVLFSVEIIPVGDERCEQGGKVVHMGFDSGRDDGIASNGLLEPGEIDGSEIICDGVNGLISLVATTTLPIGDAECELGGYRIDSGLDVDKDGALSASEVTDTHFICAPRAEVGGWGGGGCHGGPSGGGLAAILGGLGALVWRARRRAVRS